METLAFATLLFVVYFCTACCFFYSPNNSTSQLHFEPEKFNKEPIAEPVADTEESGVDEPKKNPETILELLSGVDLDKLQLRPARKIAGKLGIQQKVNGKDQPLSWLRAQIKKHFSEKPIETAPVIVEALKAS